MKREGLLLQLLAVWIATVSALGPVDERLIGWLGETYGKGGVNSSVAAQNRPGMQILSWDPRIMLYRKLLSEEECDELKQMAKPKLERSGVSNAETGAEEVDDIRTSSGMFFSRGQNPLVTRIEARIAAWTMLPVNNGEGVQVLQYLKSQRYDPHHDYFNHEHKDDHGGNRIATVLMYLTEPESGGETVFPHVPAPPEQTKAAGYSDCAMKGYAVRPRKGDAVLFWSIRPDGTFDYKSFHGSCPVIAGEKWSATKWIRVGTYGPASKPVHRVIHAPPPPPVPPGCVDSHKLCSMWSEEGECETNPGYMVGTLGQPGACLKSCQRCDLMLK